MATALQYADDATFAAHCRHIDAAVMRIEGADPHAALVELDAALGIAESPHARWNRALTLMALGRYADGLRDYRARFALFPVALPLLERILRDLPTWEGEDLAGRRLVVIAEGGFGDTIMLLRFVPQLQARGIEVALAVPPQLERLASRFAPLVGELTERDVGVLTFDMFRLLMPATVASEPYVIPDPLLRVKWRGILASEKRRKIGVAWSTTQKHAYRRQMPLEVLLQLLGPGDIALYSLQRHGELEAFENDVQTFPFEDFADLAAFVAEMDQIVTIDTAALHIAGAIGHANITCLLDYAPCWRWQSKAPWYPNVRFMRQSILGDWASVR